MGVVLRAVNVTRQFSINQSLKVNALKGINLDIEAGKLICLKGRSGSGKTTLLNILGALDRPDSGEVFWNDKDICSLSDSARDKLRRYEMAFVFQSVALIPAMTAFENVEFALRLAGFPISGRSERAKDCLTRVGLDKRMNHLPGELSGGEQQRAAIARAIAHKPKLILADEPTAELDSHTGLAVVKLFSDLVRNQYDNVNEMTVIMTTHDEAMLELADAVYMLEDGVIVNNL